ncbi:MAG: sigma-70 family RNA polymerase sigma factor [Bacteroidales bacterium]|nr:sigma-70 family RNA polymerase sigma factor [Bacteroidales bacterium]
MVYYSNEAIIEGIRLKSDLIITHIYDEMFPSIRSLVEENSGHTADAEDIFQEAMIILYHKVKNDDIILNCSFKTYLYSICKNLWLQRLGKKNGHNITNFEDINEELEIDNETLNYLQEIEDDQEKFRLFQANFLSMPKDCQKVLQLYFKKYSHREIAEIMGYRSEKYAKTRKFLCKEKLKEAIIKHEQNSKADKVP